MMIEPTSSKSFDPKINYPFLEAFFVLVKEEIDNHTIRIPKVNNPNKEERDALYSLQSNTDLTIKKADKGSVVVIMDTDNYIQETERLTSMSRQNPT